MLVGFRHWTTDAYGYDSKSRGSTSENPKEVLLKTEIDEVIKSDLELGVNVIMAHTVRRIFLGGGWRLVAQ